ncbi:MAG TPA: hypothetical protein VNN19_05400, partial [bacterium]|nr:hypothetical protein [bacterium]
MNVLRVGPPSGRWRYQRVELEGGQVLRLRAEDVAALGLAAGTALDEDGLGLLRARAEEARALQIAL